MKKTIISLMLLFMVVLLMQACGKPKDSLQRIYKGDGEFDPSIVTSFTIQDLINKGEEFTGSFVSVEGKISTMCSVGCWFFIQDESGNEIYVNLAPQNFNVPQSAVGKKVKVTGVLEAGEGNYKLSAYEVEFTEVKQ